VSIPQAFPSVAAELAGLGVATVYEGAGRNGLVDLPLVRITPGARAAGPARTVLCAQDDNRTVHAAMATVQLGDVLVLTMPIPRPVALLGDLLATQAAARGAAAILVDAAIRDADELARGRVPVWASHVRATGAVKETTGRVDVPVVVGGAEIRPGDIIVLDGDGAIVVPRERAYEVLLTSRARAEREQALRARFDAGVLSYDIYGMRAEDAQHVDVENVEQAPTTERTSAGRERESA
jgi:4-hydroxy-4-methyl-2-oxoglutarate aldolase